MDFFNITAPERDLGGFSVRRLLPHREHKMVGPFIFFDHIGPALFAQGQGIDVRPHPHIGLATVTYLFEGSLLHRDNLGSEQIIHPGAINWMTAGLGIVHSERTPMSARQNSSVLSGIQCWVALPNQYEDTEPDFTHYPSTILPKFNIKEIQFNLLLGKFLDHHSPVKVHSDLFYVEVKMPLNQILELEESREWAAYLVDGQLRIDNQIVEKHSLLIFKPEEKIILHALENSHLMLLGGSSVGERFIYWNFVASSKVRIENACQDWENGPSERFKAIPEDQEDFIPLPHPTAIDPKGTIM